MITIKQFLDEWKKEIGYKEEDVNWDEASNDAKAIKATEEAIERTVLADLQLHENIEDHKADILTRLFFLKALSRTPGTNKDVALTLHERLTEKIGKPKWDKDEIFVLYTNYLDL